MKYLYLVGVIVATLALIYNTWKLLDATQTLEAIQYGFCAAIAALSLVLLDRN